MAELGKKFAKEGVTEQYSGVSANAHSGSGMPKEVVQALDRIAEGRLEDTPSNPFVAAMLKYQEASPISKMHETAAGKFKNPTVEMAKDLYKSNIYS